MKALEYLEFRGYDDNKLEDDDVFSGNDSIVTEINRFPIPSNLSMHKWKFGLVIFYCQISANIYWWRQQIKCKHIVCSGNA